MRILFFGKSDWDDHWTNLCRSFLASHGADVEAYIGKAGDAFPEIMGRNEPYDLVISYLSPWVIPAWLLRAPTVKLGAINFHPGPPEHPGIGCYNWALYAGDEAYGVTCHLMAGVPDTGPILRVRRFPIYPSDGVAELRERSHMYLFALFVGGVGGLIDGTIDLASAHVLGWPRPPHTRTELDALCAISTSMDPAEVARRVRATRYPGKPGAYVEIGGVRFEATARDR